MSFVKKIFKSGLGGLLGLGIGMLTSGGGKRQPMQRAVTRDDAREAAARDLEIMRRRGAAADMVTGTGGAAPVSGVGRFISGS